MSNLIDKYRPFNRPWSTTHFNSSEFDSPDIPGSGKLMSKDLIYKLEDLRQTCNFAFKINSGFRSPAHNEKVKGEQNSAHLLGCAVDIMCIDSNKRFLLASFALLIGFKRIGISKSFIHLDISQDAPNPVIWVY